MLEWSAGFRAAATIYFGRRMISPEETMIMSLDEIVLLYEYLAKTSPGRRQ